MKYINRPIEFYVDNGDKRIAVVKKIEFHQLLKKPIFIAVTPYGNEVRLTRDEIHRFVGKEIR